MTAALAWSTVGEDAEGLRRFSTLDPADLACLALVRGEAHRLACALMLVWARAERILVTDPTLLPAKLIAFVSGQLGVTPAILGPYRPSPVTRAADAAIIRAHLSCAPFTVMTRRACRPTLPAKSLPRATRRRCWTLLMTG